MKIFYQPRMFQDMILFHDANANPGIVTVTAGGLAIVTSTVRTLAAGQWIYVWAEVFMAKGITGGISIIQITRASGTAIVVNKENDLAGNALIEQIPNHDPSVDWSVNLGGLMECTVGGTYAWRVFGQSSGSDGTVQIGNAQIEIIQFR